MQEPNYGDPIDEVSLKQILLFLHKGRKIIFGITGSAVIASIVFALAITPVYESHIELRPISKVNLSKINKKLHTEMQQYSIGDISEIADNILQSKELIKETLNDMAQDDANSVLSLPYEDSIVLKHENNKTTVYARGADPSILTSFLNVFVDKVNTRVLRHIQEIESNRIAIKARELILAKESELDKVKVEKINKLKLLETNISMADGLNKTQGYLNQLTQDSLLSGLDSLPDWYFYGKDILEKKREFLINETISSHEANVIDMKLRELRQFDLSFSEVRAISYDQAHKPDGAVYPHKKKIVLTSTIIAFFLSVFFVYISSIFRNKK